MVYVLSNRKTICFSHIRQVLIEKPIIRELIVSLFVEPEGTLPCCDEGIPQPYILCV